MSEKILEIKDLKVSYGHVNAVKGINFTVSKGEMVTIVGANGAGKTSLLNAVMGLIRSSGEVKFDGETMGRQAPYVRTKKGMVLVPEGRGILKSLSVHENILMGAYPHRKHKKENAENIDSVYERFPRLKERAHIAAGNLSGGEQQMLAVGRALTARPKLLILDEPSLGLAPKLIKFTLDTLSGLRDDGMTVLLIEQNVRQALLRADRAYVLETGNITMDGAARDMLTDKRVQEAFLGSSVG